MCIKPSATNKYGMALSYMSVYPAVSFDFSYQINKNWNSYITLSKNWHPMAAMSEGGATEVKMVIIYFTQFTRPTNKEVVIIFQQ